MGKYVILSIVFSTIAHLLFFLLLISIPVPTIFTDEGERTQSRVLELVDVDIEKTVLKPEPKAALAPLGLDLKTTEKLIQPSPAPSPSSSGVSSLPGVPLPQPPSPTISRPISSTKT